MKRLFLFLALCVIMSACKESKEASTKINEKKDFKEETKEETKSEPKISVEDWVREADFSRGKEYKFPWLNEEILGESAVKFNKEIAELYQDINYLFSEDDANSEEYAKLTGYDIDVDTMLKTFSLSAYFPTNGNFTAYRTIVLDVDSKKELSLEEVLKRTGYSLDFMKKQVELYDEALYTQAFDISGGLDIPEYDEYMDEQRANLDHQLNSEPIDDYVYRLFYAVSDKCPIVYILTHELVYGKGYQYKPIRLSRNLKVFALKNADENSSLALISGISEDEAKDFAAKNPKHCLNTSSDKYAEDCFLVSLKDNLNLEINSLEYENDAFKKIETFFYGTLQKGEVFKIHALIPETIPNLQIIANYTVNVKYMGEENKDIIMSTDYLMQENGAFSSPKIQYLMAESDY